MASRKESQSIVESKIQVSDPQAGHKLLKTLDLGKNSISTTLDLGEFVEEKETTGGSENRAEIGVA